MSELAALVGVHRDFRFKNKTYKVAPRDLEVEAAYEVWLEESALDAIKRHRRRFSPEEYEQQLAGWRHDCATGEVYAFDGDVSRKSMRGIAGMRKLAWLQLCKAQPVPESLVAEVAEDVEAWTELLTAMQRASGELADPTPPPPETAAGRAA